MFNALKFTEELEKAGFSRTQAETSLKVLIEVMNENFALKSDLKATEIALRSDMKTMESSILSDMKAMEAAIRSDMKAMETSLRAEIKDVASSVREMEYKLTIKLGTMMTIAIGVAATLAKIL